MAVLVGVLALLGAPPAGAVLKSDNVSLVTKLPEAAGAASGRFSPDGKTFYVSTWKGLHVYDISKPDDPQRKGFLPLPHFENEDVDAGDGIVIVSNDPSEGVGVIYVIDVTDPSLPKIRSVMPNGFISTVGNLVESPNNTGHIANCIQGCKWLWLTGHRAGARGRRPARPRQAGVRQDHPDAGAQGARHHRSGPAQARLHPRRLRRPLRDRLGHRAGRHLRLRHGQPDRPGAGLPLRRERHELRPGRAGRHRRRARWTSCTTTRSVRRSPSRRRPGAAAGDRSPDAAAGRGRWCGTRTVSAQGQQAKSARALARRKARSGCGATSKRCRRGKGSTATRPLRAQGPQPLPQGAAAASHSTARAARSPPRPRAASAT